MDRLRKIHGINVDNVDKKVDNYYGKPVECRKHQYFSVLLMKLHAKEVFPDFIYISGPHSYQHVSVDTIF